MFSNLIFIGRFQPFHNGHKHVINEALKACSDNVLILVGSSNTARTVRNPWTFEERKQMILSSFSDEEKNRLKILSLMDVPNNDQAWIAQVQKLVNDTIPDAKDETIGLIGMEKDHTSYYLKLFPNWGSIDVNQIYVYNSTDIREDYFRSNPFIPAHSVPEGVLDFLNKFLATHNFMNLVREHQSIREYKLSWLGTPYPVIFSTVDAVVIQSGHILLIRRGDYPGKGLLALPGGFVNANERLETSVVRELKEETNIKDHHGAIPPAKLKSFIVTNKVFDDPNRSARGRTITHAYLFKLPDATKLYGVAGGDDAASATWHKIGTLDPKEFFEDHYYIMQEMINLLGVK